VIRQAALLRHHVPGTTIKTRGAVIIDQRSTVSGYFYMLPARWALAVPLAASWFENSKPMWGRGGRWDDFGSSFGGILRGFLFGSDALFLEAAEFD
jgi:hypothetical protein